MTQRTQNIPSSTCDCSWPGRQSNGGKAALILDGHKLLWHQERLERWRAGERIAPITIDCALTQSCTYRCVYCYGQLQRNQGRTLTRDVILHFLDDCAAIGVKAISFVSDGESTCSPHLSEAILHGRRNGLDMALGTNGFLLKEERLADILPALTYLRFNISAAAPDRYAFIHGCEPDCHARVLATIAAAVAIKRAHNLPVTIGLQMVLMPAFADQIVPLAILGRELGVDYLVIKHCSDDEQGRLGVDYQAYGPLTSLLHEAESLSAPDYLVRAKWSKIMSQGKRGYAQCFGPPFILQLSGTGLVAPCGMLFHERYRRFHIGNIAETPFRQLWESDRYREVMDLIASPAFDARSQCGTLCLQHKVNEFLWGVRHGEEPPQPTGGPPPHVNFV